MNYGILASESCLLTDIVDQLHESFRKINIVDRLSRHLAKDTPKDAFKAYLMQVKKGALISQSSISMTVMLWNLTVTNLNLLARCVMAPNPPLQRTFTKRGMIITKCSWGWIPWSRIMWYVWLQNASCYTTISGYLLQNCATAGKLFISSWFMAFLGYISMKPETNALKATIRQTADPIREKIAFCYYRLAKGISGILSYAKEGIRLWFKTKRPAYRQLRLKLVIWIDKRINLPKSGSGGAY